MEELSYLTSFNIKYQQILDNGGLYKPPLLPLSFIPACIPSLLLLSMANLRFCFCFILVLLILFSTSESRTAPRVFLHGKRKETLMEKAQEILKEISRKQGTFLHRSLYDVNRLAPGGPDPKHH